MRLGLLAAGLGAIAGIAYFSGVGDLVRDGDEFRARLDQWGAWAPIGFVALFTLLVPVGVPGLVFVVPSIVLWSGPVAFSLSLLGGVTSSVVGIVAARYGARRAFEDRLPERFHRFDRVLVRHGVWGVVVLRVFTFLTPAADWLVGLSSVPMAAVLAGTTLGLVIPTAFVVFVGPAAFEALLGDPFVQGGVAAAVAVAVAVAVRRRRRRAAAEREVAAALARH